MGFKGKTQTYRILDKVEATCYSALGRCEQVQKLVSVPTSQE